jgi:predicted phosphodiesterase
MRYAIIADIHGNLEAFQVVLADIKAQNATHIVCLGDVVGYNANPKECLAIVREMNIPCVKGNHECQWLRDLKYTRMAANFTMVHATLDAPQRWGYVFDKLAAAASFPYQNTQVCFFGHTHVPVAFMRDTAVRGGTYSKFKIDPSKKYFINVGAVGQPRDNNPKCAYVVYDMNAGTIELRRLDYDIPTAQKKIRAAGLPERLAERLEFGR